MAKSRMFSISLCNELRFLQLSGKAQSLYFYLSLQADDDGFVGAPYHMAKMIKAGSRQLTELAQAGYFYLFPSGCGVCMDWHRNNAIRKDRYLKTIYQQELSMLKVGDDGFYILQPNDNQMSTKPQPNDNPGQGMEENEREWEDREGNDREGIPVPQQIPDTGTGSPGKEPETPDCKEACPDLPPSLEEVKNYCRHCKLQIDPVEFWNYYSKRDWKIKGTPVTNWRKLANHWNRTEGHFPEPETAQEPWAIIGCVL